MPVSVPASFVTQANLVHQDQPWRWLWEIVADEPQPPTPPTWFRLVASATNVTWNSFTWYAFNMTQSPIEWNGDGDLPSMRLALDNTGRILTTWLDQGEGFIGKRATGYLVNAANLGSSPLDYLQFDFVIASAKASRNTVELALEPPNYFEQISPVDRFNAARCRWEHGGAECGYIINGVAAFTTCSKTLGGSNGCIAHGQDEAARNLPVLHPRRFGGYAGIPVQRAI